MVQRQLKLKLTRRQEAELERWLYHLASVYNWGIRKIELNAADSIYFKPQHFKSLLDGHGKNLDIPGHVIRGTLAVAYNAWQRCFKRLGKKPRLKGKRNSLNSIPFPDPIKPPANNRIKLPGLGSVRFHKQDIPNGRIKCGRVVKRASGWHVCLFIDADPNPIPRLASGAVGIDPGFKNLLTLSTSEVIEHPREFEAKQQRLAQAQRGGNRRLASRLQERIANQRKDRNHKLSRRLVSENTLIVWSRDNHRAIASKFGKSVASSSHGQLRSMLSYKSACSGTKFIEAASKNSTRACSSCGALSGPAGFAGLSVRQWDCCACGARHDRDVNAAVNTLIAGAGSALETAATPGLKSARQKIIKDYSSPESCRAIRTAGLPPL